MLERGNGAEEIYASTRPTTKLKKPSNITVKAAVDGSVISISWEREDLIAKGGTPTSIILPIEEFKNIAAALDERLQSDVDPS